MTSSTDPEESLYHSLEPSQESRFDMENTVQAILGSGAFGEVVKVQEKLDNRISAVKLVKLCGTKPEREKITDEAKVLSRLDHENVIRYYHCWMEIRKLVSKGDTGRQTEDWKVVEESCINEFGVVPCTETEDMANDQGEEKEVNEDEGEEEEVDEDEEEEENDEDEHNGNSTAEILFIKMEFCPSTLRHAIRKPDQLLTDKENVWKILREISEGLAYIHSQDIIHRDLKPENIFLNSHDQVKIGDFGLSKLLANTLETTALSGGGLSTEPVGTPSYIAPELKIEPYDSSRVTTKIDVYSLGIIFFEMVYICIHKKAMVGMERQKILENVRKCEILLPEEFNKTAQEKAKAILLNLLTHNVNDRWTASAIIKNCPPKPIPSDDFLKLTEKAMENDEVRKHLLNKLFDEGRVNQRMDNTAKGLTLEELKRRQSIQNTVTFVFKRYNGVQFDPPELLTRSAVQGQNDIVMLPTGQIFSLPTHPHQLLVQHIDWKSMTPSKTFSITKVINVSAIQGGLLQRTECAFNTIIKPAADAVQLRNRFMSSLGEILALTSDIVVKLSLHKRFDFQISLFHTSLWMAIESIHLSNDTINLLKEFMEADSSEKFTTIFKRALPESMASINDSISQLREVQECAKQLGCSVKTVLSCNFFQSERFSMDFSEFDGPIFQVTFKNKAWALNDRQIFALGGVYDPQKINIPILIRPGSIVGVRFDFDMIVIYVENANPYISSKANSTTVLVCAIGDMARSNEALLFCRSLREDGLNVDYVQEPMQYERVVDAYCTKHSIGFAVILDGGDMHKPVRVNYWVKYSKRKNSMTSESIPKSVAQMIKQTIDDRRHMWSKKPIKKELKKMAQDQ